MNLSKIKEDILFSERKAEHWERYSEILREAKEKIRGIIDYDI